eukprot:SAG31_NODE_384_length_16414_cov_7.492308_4_plen_158_part_00
MSKTSGQTVWIGTEAPTLSRKFGSFYQRHPTSKSSMLGPLHLLVSLSAPYSAILPSVVLQIVGADPSSGLATSYRRYVKISFLRSICAIRDILKVHGSICDMPPLSWCDEHFTDSISPNANRSSHPTSSNARASVSRLREKFVSLASLPLSPPQLEA